MRTTLQVSMLPHEKCKRPRDQSACEEVEEQPNTKRRKAAHRIYPPEFWNALSKITLTRKALKEFHRRTTEEKTASALVALTRSTRLLRSHTKKLRHFAKNGGPNMDRLRGYANPPPAAATSMSKSSSRKGKRSRDSGLPSSGNDLNAPSTTGPYDPHFEQMLVDNGVYPEGYEDSEGETDDPNNLGDIQRRIAESRPSLSPSHFDQSAFKEFQKLNRAAKSESAAMSSVVPVITGAKDRRYQPRENILFNNFEEFAPGLTMAKPDKFYGARPSQIDPPVRRDLGKYITPSSNSSLPVAPNFFLEAKGGSGRSDVALRQITHDNAYGARAMFELQNYGKETPAYDGKAYALGSTYCDGTLRIYSTHPKQSATGGTEYYMTQLNAYAMNGNIESFRQGAAAFRNSRDFAKEQRDHFIASANATARERTGTSFAMANFSFTGPDTSTDGLALYADPASDESDGKARPRKRASQAAESHPRSNPLASTSNIQSNKGSIQGARQQVQDDDKANGSNNSDDERYVTADGEQDEDEGEDEDDDADDANDK